MSLKAFPTHSERMVIRKRRKASPQVAPQLQAGPPALEKNQAGGNYSGLLGLCEAPEGCVDVGQKRRAGGGVWNAARLE